MEQSDSLSETRATICLIIMMLLRFVKKKRNHKRNIRHDTAQQLFEGKDFLAKHCVQAAKEPSKDGMRTHVVDITGIFDIKLKRKDNLLTL